MYTTYIKTDMSKNRQLKVINGIVWLMAGLCFATVFASWFVSGSTSFWLPSITANVTGLIAIALYFYSKHIQRR